MPLLTATREKMLDFSSAVIHALCPCCKLWKLCSLTNDRNSVIIINSVDIIVFWLRSMQAAAATQETSLFSRWIDLVWLYGLIISCVFWCILPLSNAVPDTSVTLFRPLLHHLAEKDYVPLQIHFHIQFHWPTPSLENARFQWLVHRFGTLCQQTFGTLQTSLNSSVISRPTFLTSILILSRAFVFIRFSGFRLYIELCYTPVDSFCN